MEIKLHANATTTPRVRKYLQESDKSDRELALELGISVTTVRRWRRRENTADRQTTPGKIHKALRQEQVALINALREMLQAPLDDLLFFVTQGLEIPLSRATLNRYLKPARPSRGTLLPKGKKALSAGIVPQQLNLHYFLLSLHREDDGEHHLLMAQEPVSGWWYARVYAGMSSRLLVNWLEEALTHCPVKIQCVETKGSSWCGIDLPAALDPWLLDKGMHAIMISPPLDAQPVIVSTPLAEIIPVARNATPDELVARLCLLVNEGRTQKKLGGITPQAFLQALRRDAV
jgi:transcriptional regulator with XRE-family HTH domain